MTIGARKGILLLENCMKRIGNTPKTRTPSRRVTDQTPQEAAAALCQARAIEAVGRIREVAHEHGLDRLTPEEIDAEIRRSRAERHRW